MARYDWSKARRGFWVGKLQLPDQNRILDADLVEAFPDSESVNDALRALLRASMRITKPRPKKSRNKPNSAPST